MTRMIRYLSHPQVRVDPARPVPAWSLSPLGAARAAGLAGAAALRRTTRVISSAETKALETASPIAAALGVTMEIRPGMHENDRSATCFLPPEAFEQVADAFFAEPERSVRGWERAVDAQARILRETRAALAQGGEGDVLIVGHGGVGTLLWCALAGAPIDRRHDQGPGGGGNWFAFRDDDLRPTDGWRPMELLAEAPGR